MHGLVDIIAPSLWRINKKQMFRGQARSHLVPGRIQKCDLAHSFIHRHIAGVCTDGLGNAASLPRCDLQEWHQLWMQGQTRCLREAGCKRPAVASCLS